MITHSNLTQGKLTNSHKMHITNIVIDQHYNVFLMLDPGLRVALVTCHFCHKVKHVQSWVLYKG